MRLLLKIMFLMLSALMVTGAAHGAPPDKARVSLLVCSEGGEIYELEGHAALRIEHPLIGDIAVNWGVFDFDSPNFIYRFVKGETDYIAAAGETRYFLESYRRQGRTVTELELNLDSVQTSRLVDLVLNNLRPENRVYRYNYVLDNCATRPLAVIEQAIGDTLSLAPSPLSAHDSSTFRNVMRHYHRNYPWYQLGIDTALGPGIDRRISQRENTFAPVVLDDMLRGARLPSGEPLVISERYVVGGPSTPPAPAGPTPWWLTPLFIGWMVAAIALTVSVMQLRGYRSAARWFDTIYFAILGLDGLLLAFLIFVSVHEATSPNWLFLWINPLALLGAVAPWLKNPRYLEFTYQSVNFALLIALAVIFMIGIQSPNPTFIPLMAATAMRSATIIYRCIKDAKTSR